MFQHVWSDTDHVLSYLADVQEFIASCQQRTLAAILNKVEHSLTPVLDSPYNCSTKLRNIFCEFTVLSFLNSPRNIGLLHLSHSSVTACWAGVAACRTEMFILEWTTSLDTNSRTLFVREGGREDVCRDVHVTSNVELRNNVRLLLNVELRNYVISRQIVI